MSDATDYLAHVKATRQRIIDAGLRHAQTTEQRQAADAERERQRRLQQLAVERVAGMPASAGPELREALTRVLLTHDVTWAEITSHDKAGRLHPARQDIYAILRAQGLSYPAIARFCGRICHTSIMSALRNHTYRQERDARAKRLAE